MNNKGTDQTALVRRLVCVFIIRINKVEFFRGVANSKKDISSYNDSGNGNIAAIKCMLLNEE